MLTRISSHRKRRERNNNLKVISTISNVFVPNTVVLKFMLNVVLN